MLKLVVRSATEFDGPATANFAVSRNLFCRALITEAIQDTNHQNPFAKTQLIPLHIVQFWDEATPPSDVRECMETWKRIGKFKYEQFDLDSAHEFIRENSDNETVEAFTYCHHPAMKCDYFRLLYLSLRGGMYVDADNVYSGAPFEHVACDGYGLRLQHLCAGDHEKGIMIEPAEVSRTMNILPIQKTTWKYYFNNDPIIACPNHPVITLALKQATIAILEAKKKGIACNIHWVTGPDNLTNALYCVGLQKLRDSDDLDFFCINVWPSIGSQRWELSYRNTNRDWRLGEQVT